MSWAQAVPKPKHDRGSLKRSQRSEATPKVRAEVKARSNGVCEKCDRSRSAELAHCERRWHSEDKPNQYDFIDLCKACHRFCDSCEAGRKWMREFQRKLLNQKMEEIQ